MSSAAWAVLTVLVLLRLRRLAGVAATGLVVWLAVALSGIPGWAYAALQSMNVVIPLALEASPCWHRRARGAASRS